MSSDSNFLELLKSFGTPVQYSSSYLTGHGNMPIGFFLEVTGPQLQITIIVKALYK